MPLMSPMPIPFEQQEIVLQNQILQQSGCKDIALDEDELVKILIEEGAGLREVVKNVSVLAKYAENESVRHASARTLLELHGKLGKRDDNGGNKVVINIVQNSGSQVKLQGILNPTR